MKSIFIPLERTPQLQAQLETAILVARKFGAHIAGAAPRSDFRSVIIGAGGIGAVAPIPFEDFDEQDRARAEDIHTTFLRSLSGAGILIQDRAAPSGNLAASWIERVEPGDLAIGRLARLYELSVLARPGAGDQAPRRELLETVLFESGRPLLMTPPRAPSRIGSNIVIAWNGSTETARVISFAMPFLKEAERVLILTVEGGMVEGPSGAELRSSLMLSAISAESRHIESTSQATGRTILDVCLREGADLLIKGAYTNSRLRQLIFGGATDHILVNANLPVLFAH
jgi:nucleotide-binding universal stress UspA family protein